MNNEYFRITCEGIGIYEYLKNIYGKMFLIQVKCGRILLNLIRLID